MARIYTVEEYAEVAPREYNGINWNHYFSKAFDQLRGISFGILADGEVNDSEAKFFRDWIKENAAVQQVWPFNDIAARIQRIFADGIVTADEREEIRSILEDIIDGKAIPTAGAKETAWESVFSKPEPEALEFSNNVYSLTGKFAFGGRAAVVKKIVELGGQFSPSPDFGTRVLLIGSFGSPAWKNSNFGNKIARAIELQQAKHPIQIVREEVFARSIPR